MSFTNVGSYFRLEDVPLRLGVNTLQCVSEDEHGNALESLPCVITVQPVCTSSRSPLPARAQCWERQNDVDPGDGFAVEVCVDIASPTCGHDRPP